MFLIGITGGVATGKSTVTKILQDCGCSVVDADAIAKSILQPGEPAYRDAIKKFGHEILNTDGTIDRASLADIIFKDTSKRKQLNAITHPRIAITMFWQIFKHFMHGKKFVLLDIPLLIETKFWLKFVKEVVIVYCEPDVQLERLKKRNNVSEDEATMYINGQMPVKDKLKFATHIINNDTSLENTKKQVLNFHAMLQERWSFNIYQWCIIIGISCAILCAVF